MIVSTQWLTGHLRDPEVVVLAVGQKADYDMGHIPESRFIDFASIRTAGGADALNTELPPMKDLAAAFGKLGVSSNSRIVLYMLTDWLSPMARVYLTLDAMGLGARASILDGSLAIWKSEHRPVTRETPAVNPGRIDPCPQSDVIANLDYVRSHLRTPGAAIVDARLPQFYSGAQSGQRGRAGHIPGAGSLPFNSLVEDNGKFRSLAALQELFRAAGAQPGDRVVSYCHVGQQASVVYFVARYLGYDARMYDGSMDEWSRHDDLPLEK
jgi:thiosulfate/3-mercaptopyruvate sulfurtransferase